MFMSHGTCTYFCMYVNTVADNVMLQLYLWNNFYNIIFNIKHKLYIASGWPFHLPPMKTSGCCTPPHVECYGFHVVDIFFM